MHSSTSHTARHTESRTKRARRPYDDAPDQRPTDTSNRSRASSTPAEATSTYVLGLSSLSRANDLSLGRDAIPPSSLADQEGPWPLMAPISNLLASTGAEAHYTTASSAFHSDLLGPDDFPGTVSLFNPSTPSPAPPPLMEPYAHYRPEASHHYANNLSLGSSHAGSAFELDLSPMVKAEEDSTDWYPDHSDSGSSLSANLSETYDAQSHFQRSPHHAWHANAPINQAQDFQRLEHHSGKLPIKSSVRPATGPQKSCQCNICGRLFGKRSNLKTHEQYKHCLNYVKRFECPNAECGRKFDRKMDLKRHIKSVHDKIRDVECEFCGLSFPRVDTKQRHAKHCPSRFFGPRERTTSPIPPLSKYHEDQRYPSPSNTLRAVSENDLSNNNKGRYYQQA